MTTTAKYQPRLTIDDLLIDQIARIIENGATPVVAAQSQGVPRKLFYAWLDPLLYPELIYDRLRCAVETASSIARAEAEIMLRQDKPDVWLTHGPYRDEWKKAKEQLEHTQTEPLKVAHLHVVAPSKLSHDQLSLLSYDELRELEQKLIDEP